MDADAGAGHLLAKVEEGVWPLVETFVGSHDVAGLAVAVVRDEEVVSRGFGVRDVGTGAPVTPETMFHLASVSKPFVATAVVSLATARDAAEPVLDLDAPIIEWVPEFTLADGRAAEVTARHLLSHSSGLPDVGEYGWHEPQLGDDALSDFARSLSDWRLESEPGSTFSYSNAGFELLGLLLSRALGTTFEDAIRRLLLVPLGMRNSTFLRADVPAHLAASPHVGMPLTVPEGVYPYTRRHAPSSTLHSNLVEMCRWMVAHLEPVGRRAGGSHGPWRRLDAGGSGRARLERGHLPRAADADAQRSGPGVRGEDRPGARRADRGGRAGQLQHRARLGHGQGSTRRRSCRRAALGHLR
jgi:CubicO group peptidase (beta-lactamase class C family)